MINNSEELRLTDEFGYLIKKYPNIAFNAKDWGYNRNLPSDGKKHLFVTEPITTIPENFNIDIISQYETYIVYSSKIYDMYKDITNCILLRYPLRYQNYYKLNNFINFNNKINGIVSIQTFYNPPNPVDACIMHLRDDFMSNKKLQDQFQVDAFGPKFYGGDSYRGNSNAQLTNNFNLELTSRYKFRFCPESIYHEIWSNDHITERIFACFESKTIPIYIGAYNIDDIIPKDFFIDFRKYRNNYEDLFDKLNSISESEYTQITEEAFLWQKNNKMGSMDYAEEVFSQLK